MATGKSNKRSMGKENAPPRVLKQPVSVARLFKRHAASMKTSTNTRDVLAPRPAGITKPAASKSDPFSSSSRASKAAKHPLCRNFAQTAEEYRRAVATSTAQDLEPICDQLIARVDRLSVDGVLHDGAILLSPLERDELAKASAMLTKPFAEETVSVRVRQPDGTHAEFEVKLEDTIRKFGKLLAKAQPRINELLKEMRNVDAEIESVYESIRRTEKREVPKLRNDLDVDLKACMRAAADAKASTATHVESTREQIRAKAAAEQQRLNDYLDAED